MLPARVAAIPSRCYQEHKQVNAGIRGLRQIQTARKQMEYGTEEALVGWTEAAAHTLQTGGKQEVRGLELKRGGGMGGALHHNP